MNGYYVSRRFGWDCHGLPVEYEIDKKLGIKTREDVLSMGIDIYNEQCRSIVMRYSKEWEKTVVRLGRWIDFENDYKTLDPSFMESVWWVFKNLYDQGLVYRGFKVMPFSTGCNTPLSNFEAGQNYKDVNDPAVVVSFPICDDPDGASLLAWTTTPWTLPSNLALCVNPSMDYVRVKDPEKNKVYILAEARLAQLPGALPKKSKKKDIPGFPVLSKVKGSDLYGLQYEPLFDFFKDWKQKGAFRVLVDDYVTSESGTGVVHQAPAFGEDDYRVCVANNVIQLGGELACPVDSNGNFTDEVSDFAGLYVKDADKSIIAAIKSKGRLVDHSNIEHSYPFCWRSDTPLIYKAVPSWFVKVEQIKDKLLKNNQQTYWVPSYVKDKRFHNWLENAHDWAISRSRFWGTPIPIWESEDQKERVVVGSIDELRKLSGNDNIKDIHRHFIDGLRIAGKNGQQLRRIDDVFDCWFESGSMPYAQVHYPFENKQKFETNFPADFVAEGLDQTRGWFYTLMVLSTALFDKPAFKNLVCNGLVLAADGQKMSKSKQNYPDPTLVVDKYGADALRLYLINSPVVRAETLQFQETGVGNVLKDVFLPWYNAYRFMVQNAKRWEDEFETQFLPSQVNLDSAQNVLDRWITASSRSLVNFVRTEMDGYRLYTVVPYLVSFIDQLTNMYVRYNRSRLKGKNGKQDTEMALATLFDVLLKVSITMAPFTPFFTESMYQNMRLCMGPNAPESVHFCQVPAMQKEHEGDRRIQVSVERMQRVIELARTIRERKSVPLKFPLKNLVVVHTDEEFLFDVEGELKEYVIEEVNVRNLTTCKDPLKYATLRAEPNWQVLGKRLGKDLKSVASAIKDLNQQQILNLEEHSQLEILGHVLSSTDVCVKRDFKLPLDSSIEEVDANGDGEVLVVLDLKVDTELIEAGIARELVNRFQKLRKKCGLAVSDIVEFYYEALDGESEVLLSKVINAQNAYLTSVLGSKVISNQKRGSHALIIAEEETEIGSENLRCGLKILLVKPAISFDKSALLDVCNKDNTLAENVQVYLIAKDLDKLKAEASQDSGCLSIKLMGNSLKLQVGKHIFWSNSK
eukprot:TRINITY_DN32893_c0_g2_i4.p1 TRINITY_DN32893_c0_g2~~TRINITY_DN32893_c0_g2_i4.p1  ORF type:complete len:1193 (+),score=122.61 TRINITY_DN32893_c0_g2_i4:332-3580(+)